MVDLKGLLSNPMAAYKSASQPGGLLAPVTSMNQFLGDPRVNIGLAIASGQPLGKAIMGGALQAQQVREALTPEEEKRDIRVINNQAVDFTDFENPQVLGDYGTSEPNFKNATIKTEAGELIQGRENEDTGQLEILTNNGYIPAPPSAIKTPVSVAATGVEDLGFKAPGVKDFSESMGNFQKTDSTFNALIAALDDPNTMTASIPRGTVNLINNLRANVEQGLTFFADDAKKKKITQAEFMKKNQDTLKIAGGASASYQSLLVTAAYSLASSFNPDGRISDRDFKAAFETLTGGGSDKDVIKQAIMTQKNLNRTNAFNFINNANTFGVAVPEGVNYNTFFPDLPTNVPNKDIIYPDMILDINGNLVPL